MNELRADQEDRSAVEKLNAAADLLRSATLDPHTAADLILDTEAHACVLGKSFCYVCSSCTSQT